MADSSGLDHSNLQAQAVALTISFPILATIGVGLRLYSRFLTRTFGLGNYLNATFHLQTSTYTL
jgi:hypothetical protein